MGGINVVVKMYTRTKEAALKYKLRFCLYIAYFLPEMLSKTYFVLFSCNTRKVCDPTAVLKTDKPKPKHRATRSTSPADKSFHWSSASRHIGLLRLGRENQIPSTAEIT